MEMTVMSRAAGRPVGKENISWTAVGPGNEGRDFLLWGEGS